MARDLTLRIIIEQQPPGVDFGLQKGSGSVYDTVQKQRSQGKDLVYRLRRDSIEGDLQPTAPARVSLAGAAAALSRET
jgi:hypothetical protein